MIPIYSTELIGQLWFARARKCTAAKFGHQLKFGAHCAEVIRRCGTFFLCTSPFRISSPCPYARRVLENGPTAITRFWRLTPERRRLLLDAIETLCLVSILLRFSFRRTLRFGQASPRSASAEAIVENCVWAIETAARLVPVRAKCIEQGIALQRMLRKRGVEARLHYGARTSPNKNVEAHVWVTVDSTAVLGGEEAAAFVELAAYP